MLESDARSVNVSLTHTNPQSSYCGYITHAHRRSTSVTVYMYHTHMDLQHQLPSANNAHTQPSTSVTAGIWHKQTFNVSITNRHTQTFNVNYCQHNSQRISTAVTVGTCHKHTETFNISRCQHLTVVTHTHTPIQTLNISYCQHITVLTKHFQTLWLK